MLDAGREKTCSSRSREIRENTMNPILLFFDTVYSRMMFNIVKQIVYGV